MLIMLAQQNQKMLSHLCEGDSAKAGVVSGLSTEDRNIFGVYPLKGKLLNVRGEAVKKYLKIKKLLKSNKFLAFKTAKNMIHKKL